MSFYLHQCKIACFLLFNFIIRMPILLFNKLKRSTTEEDILSDHIPKCISFSFYFTPPFRTLLFQIMYLNASMRPRQYDTHTISCFYSKTIGIIKRPWWNEEITKDVKLKRRAFNRFKKNPTSENYLVVLSPAVIGKSSFRLLLLLLLIRESAVKFKNNREIHKQYVPSKLATDTRSTLKPREVAEVIFTHFENCSIVRPKTITSTSPWKS